MAYYETELTLGRWDQFPITVAIEYEKGAFCDEFFQMATKIRVDNVVVTGFSGPDFDLDRDGLGELGDDGSWLEYVDRIAFKRVNELVDAQDWLFDHLCSNDEDDLEEDEDLLAD